VNGDSGEAGGAVLHADVTVTFAALKPGLLQGDGAELAGRVVLVDIGVGVSTRRAVVVEDDDVAQRLPARAVQSHKWASAVAVVAGSPGMEGAGALSSMGASHAGAGMVRLAVPGSAIEEGGMRPGPWPLEAVRLALGSEGWADAVLEILGRCKGARRRSRPWPGARDPARDPPTRRRVTRAVVADADALAALGDADAARSVIAGDGSVHRPVVLTPHDGEYHGLMGEAPGPDRFAAARRLAAATGAVALVKGPSPQWDCRWLTMASTCSWLGPAALGWRPPAPATCCRGSSARCSPEGSRHPGRPHSAPTSMGGRPRSATARGWWRGTSLRW